MRKTETNFILLRFTIKQDQMRYKFGYKVVLSI